MGIEDIRMSYVAYITWKQNWFQRDTVHKYRLEKNKIVLTTSYIEINPSLDTWDSIVIRIHGYKIHNMIYT